MPALVLAVTLGGCATPVGGVASPGETGAPATSPSTTNGPTTGSAPSGTSTPSPAESAVPLPDPVPTETGSARVTIVNWNADGRVLSASGLVTGARDAGGLCTLTATSDSGQVLTAEVDAQSTPAAINCGLIDIPAPTGVWQLVLSYLDGETVLSSEPISVDQP